MARQARLGRRLSNLTQSANLTESANFTEPVNLAQPAQLATEPPKLAKSDGEPATTICDSPQRLAILAAGSHCGATIPLAPGVLASPFDSSVESLNCGLTKIGTGNDQYLE
ncbi:hypothetical protein Pla52o_40520 [Novipirellula galeiformis]|uniref:Uncharacterized protein n=1 Tax=Novipirellula galeiformis TaxID=2528004 RepID=A0A5C6C8W0_9BACT|nr:hypothetical protein Pla52o_40520 [Novipirellula galeiformis]